MANNLRTKECFLSTLNFENLEHKYSFTNGHDHINKLVGRKYTMLFYCLNILGMCPVGFNSGTSKFEISWFSTPAVVSYISALWVISTWTVYSIEMNFGVPIFDKSWQAWKISFFEAVSQDPSLNRFGIQAVFMTMRIVLIIVPVSQIYQLAFRWLQTGKLVKFLNNWHHFQDEFNRLFWDFDSEEFNPKDSRQIKMNLGLRKGLTREFRFRFRTSDIFLVSWILVPSTLLPISFLAFKENPNIRLSYEMVVGFTLVTGLTFADLVDDVKHMMLYRTLADAFQMINWGISSKAKTLFARVDGTDAKDWRDLIQFVRDQSDLLCKYQKPSQLYCIVQCIVLLTLCIFLILNISWENSHTFPVALSWGMFTASQFLRLFVKVAMAERITQEEDTIALNLAAMNLPQNAVTLAQVKFTHEVITKKPTQITFGTYVVFNKRLILSVFSQVVTYLIVLMQFVQK